MIEHDLLNTFFKKDKQKRSKDIEVRRKNSDTHPSVRKNKLSKN